MALPTITSGAATFAAWGYHYLARIGMTTNVALPS
jgi:hypothetical protein